MGACGTNRNFTTHMGGAARILELRGPRDFQNPSSFERALLRAVTVGVVSPWLNASPLNCPRNTLCFQISIGNKY